ncbi:MAG TPA: hypothetical protein VLC12_01695, partial [Terriglobales bacterium]|nr:hypothetical protein [Terriglobales bacterium]
AGALAGAYTFQDAAKSQPAAAQNAAIAVAVQTKILGQPLTAADFTPSAASPCPATSASTGVCADTTNRRVTVYIARTGPAAVGTFFARAIGWKSVAVATRATAEASKQAGGTHCLKPFYIANTVVAVSDPDVTTACGSGHYLFDPANPGSLTVYAQAQMGQPITLRPVGPKNAAVPSQYASLDFGSGASTYSCVISHCLNDPSCKVDPTILKNFTGECGDSLETQNGNDPNKTYWGINDLISPGGAAPDSWYQSNPTSQGFVFCYESAPSTTCDSSLWRDTSQSLITAPVWDNCKTSISTGKQTVPLIGFVEVFVDGVDKGTGNITAHLVTGSSCGGGGSGPGSGAGPAAIPVRLIQGP